MSDRPVPLIVRRTIPAPRDRIFDAFSQAELLTQWFTPSVDIGVEAVEFFFSSNRQFRLRYTMPDGRHPIVSGVFERIDRPECIVMTWMWEAPDPLENIPMKVTFRFVDTPAGTEIIITHEGIPSDTACTIHADGWEGTLTSLERFLALEKTG